MLKRPYVDIPDAYLPKAGALPGELTTVAEVVERHLPGLGVRVALILAQEIGSGPVYIHNVQGIINEYIYERMRADYDQGGVTAKELARKYGISLGHAEKILRRVSRSEREDNQLSLF